MKNILALILAFTIISTLNFCKKSAIQKHQTVDYKTTQEGISANAKIIKQKLGSKYSPEVAFLVDMRIPSNKYRFFIYDLKNNKILDRGMVAHGSGSETGVPGKLKFSNVENSLMTSLGTYSVGKSYSGQFGKAYKLYGLEDSNSNAYQRAIVLHKYSKMPFTETKTSICLSYGCPMVNEKFFAKLEKIIDNSKKPILLRIYY